MGANFTGWLKILDVPLYILPGIICLALYPGLKNPDEAYMTMVTNLFPVGMVGLVLAVLTAALISTVGSALNALSTVFTMDIYVKKFRPLASQKEIIRTGHVVTMAGALISVIITIAIDSIKGLNLFNVFQSVLGFIAPPMAAGFPVRHLLETNYHDGCQHGIDIWYGVQHGSGHSLFMGISCRKIYSMASLHDAVFLPVRCHQRRHDFGILIG